MITHIHSGSSRRLNGAHQEALSMSDYAHGDRRPRMLTEHRTIESRAMFAGFYALFLVRAVLARLMPWRKHISFGGAPQSDSIFKEARNAASVMVASSFMGL
jgi:hypothetical protein